MNKFNIGVIDAFMIGLQLMLIGLKLTGSIGWAWPLVLAPMISLVVVVFAVAFVVERRTGLQPAFNHAAPFQVFSSDGKAAVAGKRKSRRGCHPVGSLSSYVRCRTLQRGLVPPEYSQLAVPLDNIGRARLGIRADELDELFVDSPPLRY